MYSRDTINVSPDTSNSIIKNETDSLLGSSVFTKIHRELDCNEFLENNGGASSIIMDAFGHWHKKDIEIRNNSRQVLVASFTF